MKGTPGYRAKGRKIICADDAFELREVITPFGKADSLDSETLIFGTNPSTGSLREPQGLTTGSLDQHT